MSALDTRCNLQQNYYKMINMPVNSPPGYQIALEQEKIHDQSKVFYGRA